MNYDSDYGATRRITAEQKLAEIACSRIAAKEGRAIGNKFWNDPAWTKVFHQQRMHATSLLRVFDAEAVFTVLRTRPWIVSLGHPGLGEFADEEQRAIDRRLREALAEEPAVPAPPEDAIKSPRPTPARNSNSIRSKLKDL